MNRTIGPCPEPSVLAAFVERKLDRGERETVMHHVALCAECVTVIAGASRSLRDGERRSRLRPKRWWLPAAALMAMMIGFFVLRTPSDPSRRLVTIAAEDSTRSTEGRLHRFEHRPYSSLRSGAPATGANLSLRAEDEKLSRRFGSDAATLHARGTAALLLGEEQRAVSLLTAAARAKPEEPAYWIDLSAAQIALGVAARDENAFIAALNAADRAIGLAPGSAEAHFNRALAAEHLGRTSLARESYRRALAVETSPAWRAEIRQRIAQFAE